ncbi:hypothetical protein E0Z10_g3334 [Xylaria hypoxylon]|uniref:PA domain-containing protein n=1 Tax=Xylaria hypoxylon TaxID=37992 RepID=A0A4Z0YNU8_9PEZI|nr:hypothetical protein E0Z10_g3334 [Xylaria hypoxylon]
MKGISSTMAITATGLLALNGNAEPIHYPSECKLPLVKDVRPIDSIAKPLVNSIHLKDLLKCAQDLEDIAYATPARNRVHGSEGHHGTIQYFKDTLESLGDYYKVELQEFTTEVTLASAQEFSAGGVIYDTDSFEFGNNGTWTDVPLVNVANLGCDPEDVPDSVAGNVALIARGDCTFAQKITNAGAKRAVAAMIYNNLEAGVAAGTLGGVNDLIPLGGLTQADGLVLAEHVPALQKLTHAERGLVLDRSIGGPDVGDAAGTVVDARLILEESINNPTREDMLGLKGLFEWVEWRAERAQGQPDNGEKSEGSSSKSGWSGDGWLRESIIEGLKGGVWLAGKE